MMENKMALNRRGIVGLAGAVLSAGLLLGGVARAQADSALPAVQKSGAVEYLSGGIGLDESTAIQSASRHWPLSLVFSVQAAPRAEYASDVKLEIRDAKGRAARDHGQRPLPAGQAGAGQLQLARHPGGQDAGAQVQIKAGSSARVELVWPAGTNQGKT
jgi:hypothetical protein